MSIDPTEEDLLIQWNENDIPFEERDRLLKELQAKGLFPRLMQAQDEWESEGGLYPDTSDPKFTEKLMRKLEFAENKQASIREQLEEGVDPCDPEKEFELTPVQRFIGRYLSPQCPYQSALLYHGVGVGKTCAAINVAENYLRTFPRKSVFIVAPRTIQSGFRRTLFDLDALQIPSEEDRPNVAKGCTGNTYLKRTGSEFEKDRAVIGRRVTQAINARYTIMGYIQFQRYIDDILKSVPQGADERATEEARARKLRQEFSGRLLIIDEAHNLRDTPGEMTEDNTDNPGGETELSESQAGKKLTPALLKVLDAAEGLKLMLLTGTPMYNSFKEIVFLLNLLLVNDKKATLSERDIFLPTGAFRKGGEEILGAVANAYVSFMRGENPLSFPVRLPPEGVPRLEEWPTYNPLAEEISEEQRERMRKLPIIPVNYEGELDKVYEKLSESAILASGLGITSISEMVQGGNWIFPGDGEPLIRDIGFDSCFRDTAGGRGLSHFRSLKEDARWLLRENLGRSSPKAKLILSRIPSAQGVIFVYSQFIKSGSLPFALALEANGYTLWKEDKGLFENGIQDGLGRQCALCSRREKMHAGSKHKFVPACYILLTGNGNLSPNNAKAIQAARSLANKEGREIKVIIGSSVASEGVDFRFVREIYMFDSWFHLNKMEQVLGRGIRTCSHALLPPEQRNCTIHLLVNQFAQDLDTETSDMYMYRSGMNKAVQMGRITRTLKRYALDCNLNRDAIIVAGLDTQRHIDSQGKVREEVNINDTPFTNLCDWIETCEYKCAKAIDLDSVELDTSTYDEYAVRWRESQVKKAIRSIFQEREQPIFRLEELQEMLSAIPAHTIAGILGELVGNQAFHLRIGPREGYIVYRNGYYLFQPDYLKDQRIPLALRVANVPVKIDSFEPLEMKLGGPPKAIQKRPGALEEVAQVAPAPEATAPGNTLVVDYWNAIHKWSEEISLQTAIKEDIPEFVKKAVNERYSGDEAKKEFHNLIMFNWFYEHILQSESYSLENKSKWLKALSKVLLEFVWDESLRPMEQQLLLKAGVPSVKEVAAEQLVQKGGTEAFRFIDPMTGLLKYICGDGPCSEAVTRVFEADPADPIRAVKVDRTATGAIYGFMVPKSKEGRLIFKTNVKVPEPGGVPEKGSECSNISNMNFHIEMLKEIGQQLVLEGYPKFLLVEEVLDQKILRKREKEEAKIAGKKSAAGQMHLDPRRTFENANRACALKEIMLRWMDISEKAKGGGSGGKRYFYRPIASLKTKHKGIILKGGGKGKGRGATGRPKIDQRKQAR